MYYENFQKLCDLNNVRPAAVSKATGISTATLTAWKQGKYTPKPQKLQTIADFFGVSIEYIMKGEESGNVYVAVDSKHQVLVNAMNNVKPENIQLALDFLKKLS